MSVDYKVTMKMRVRAGFDGKFVKATNKFIERADKEIMSAWGVSDPKNAPTFCRHLDLGYDNTTPVGIATAFLSSVSKAAEASEDGEGFTVINREICYWNSWGHWLEVWFQDVAFCLEANSELIINEDGFDTVLKIDSVDEELDFIEYTKTYKCCTGSPFEEESSPEEVD